MERRSQSSFWIFRLALCSVLACATLCGLQWYPTQAQAQSKPGMSLNDVLELAKLGYKDAQIIREIDRQRMRGRFYLTPSQVLQLRRAGVSLKVIRVMGVGRKPQPTRLRRSTPSSGRKVGILGRGTLKPGVFGGRRQAVFNPLTPGTLPPTRLYTHIGRRYQLKIPRGWRVYESITPSDAKLTVHIVKQRVSTATTPAQLTRTLNIAIHHHDRSDRFLAQRSLAQLARHAVSLRNVHEAGLVPIQKLRATTFLGKPAYQISFKGKRAGGKAKVRLDSTYIRIKGGLLEITTISPSRGSFRRSANKLSAKIVLQQPGAQKKGQRLAKEASVQTLIQQSTKAVVSISVGYKRKGKLVYRASGSGFVVTPSGYVLTNHHVAMNSRTGKPYRSYTLNWDRNTQQASVKARFVAAFYQYPQRRRIRLQDPKTGRISVKYQKQHVDIALLKIIGKGPYPHAKMTSIKNALLGDSVIAMGFPLEGRGIQDLGNEDITATTGRISRLVRLANRRVNEIQHTAKIAGGNSGGPLFDSFTGGVIGINTWVGVFDKNLKRPAMGLGYYYALPIDLAWQYFPDYLEHEGKSRTLAQWYELGNQWAHQGREKPAIRALRKVLMRAPSFQPAYIQLTRLLMRKAMRYNNRKRALYTSRARRLAKLGLSRNPNNIYLLRLLTKIDIVRGSWSTAEGYLNRALQLQPRDWRLYLLRSRVWRVRNNTQRALADADLAIQLAGQQIPDGYITKGVALYDAKQYIQGQKSFQKALQIERNSLQALLLNALGHSHQGNHGFALRQLLAIEKKFPYEPRVYRGFIIAHIKSKNSKGAWDNFQKYMRSCALRSTTPEDYMYYLGGNLAQRVLSPKIRDRIRWGLWSAILHRYTQSTYAAKAGIRLAREAQKKGMRGITYALIRLLSREVRQPAYRRILQKLQRRMRPRGLSHKELTYLLFYPAPQLSPKLMMRLFLITPTVLEKRTAIAMFKKKIPARLVILMWKISKRRRRQMNGIRSRSRGRSRRLLLSRRGPSARESEAIKIRVAQAMNALTAGRLTHWMSAHDPRGNTTRYRTKFYRARLLMRTNKLRYYKARRYRLRAYRHPRYGRVMRYYFRASLRGRAPRYYFWELRQSRGKWMLF